MHKLNLIKFLVEIMLAGLIIVANMSGSVQTIGLIVLFIFYINCDLINMPTNNHTINSTFSIIHLFMSMYLCVNIFAACSYCVRVNHEYFYIIAFVINALIESLIISRYPHKMRK